MRQPFTLRGLYGHLRLVHGKKGKALAKWAQMAKGDLVEQAEEVFALLTKARAILANDAELKRLKETGSFVDESKYEELREGLKRQANEIEAKLKGHDVTLTDAYLEKDED
ncbi:MAG: hypothetical protein C4293_03495 [Nitrospiraceae bacterium]